VQSLGYCFAAALSQLEIRVRLLRGEKMYANGDRHQKRTQRDIHSLFPCSRYAPRNEFQSKVQV
jgi:hypothetical protein